MSSTTLFRFSTAQLTALKISVIRLVLTWQGSGVGGGPISAENSYIDMVSIGDRIIIYRVRGYLEYGQYSFDVVDRYRSCRRLRVVNPRLNDWANDYN